MSKAKRGKAQAKSWYPDPALVRKRVAEMTRAYQSSFPQRRLPNNGLGRKWARYMMRTKRLYPGALDYLWVENWCPWMDESECDRILSYKGHWYSSGSLGERLEIDNAMRKELRLWTMRPNDVPWEQVQSEMRQRQYMRTQAKRRRNGVRTSAERKANSARAKAALGISRAKYYRLGLHKTGETVLSRVSIPVGTRDLSVSPSKPDRPALAGRNVIPFPKRPKPKLVWTAPTPEQIARMAELQRAYACTAAEPTATELELAA
jgi:hypothetical protein